MRADGRLEHSLPLIVAALLAAFLPQIANKPPWITLFLVTCAGYRLLAERRRLRLTPAWIRTVLGLGSFIAVLQVYGGINGVGPGSALLAVMAALKLLET
ncbi:MAG: transglutaminaseTgpA domain-containing protein, partial [Pseudomonadota bacterium]